MDEYISREAASADSDRNKIKTPFARIVVEGTPGKPYYNIWFFDPANGECRIGFGSYCLDNVFNWLAAEFEITEPHTDVAPVVRCKDCKYYRVSAMLAPNKFCFRLKHPVEDRPIGYNFAPDDFCSHGERLGEVKSDG